MVHGCRSYWVNVVSVYMAMFLGPLLFLLYTLEFFYILETTLIGYGDDFTLIVVVPSTGVRVAVTESMIRDLGRLSEAPWPRQAWCIGSDIWFQDDIWETFLLCFYSSFSWESPRYLVSWTSPGEYSMLGRHLGDAFEVLSWYRFGVEYCSAVWSSAPDTHLKLLYRVVSRARLQTAWGCVECGIAHRRSVVVLSMLYKIRCNRMLPLYGALSVKYVPEFLWSHIGILIRLLAIEPRSTIGPLFLSQCPCGTILVNQYSMVWDSRVSRAGPMFFLLA